MNKINPTSAFLAVTYRCNSRCIMCDLWKRNNKDELLPEIYQKLPNNLKNIDITGGEPFLRKDLVEIIEILRKTCPKSKLLITTNGLLPEKIKKMSPEIIRKGNVAFRISLDGWDQTHDRIRGVTGAFKKAIKSINILQKINVKNLGVIFTLMESNKNDLPKVLNYCKKQKLQFSLNLVHNSSIYFGSNHSHLRIDNHLLKESLVLVKKYFYYSLNPKNLAKLWFYKKLENYAITHERPIKCGIGENFFYLDPYGTVYLCQFKNWPIGNLKKQSFKEILNGEKTINYLQRSCKCHDCFMICTTKDEIKKHPFLLLR